jgi:hypothetical protein
MISQANYSTLCTSDIWSDLKLEISKNGFGGLRNRLVAMGSYSLRLAYSFLSDNGCVEFLSKMAFDIFQAIEDNDKNTLKLGIDCFKKMLNFICQSKPDLCFDGRGNPKNFSLIRFIYFQVFRNNHVSR